MAVEERMNATFTCTYLVNNNNIDFYVLDGIMLDIAKYPSANVPHQIHAYLITHWRLHLILRPACKAVNQI